LDFFLGEFFLVNIAISMSFDMTDN